MAKQTTKTTAQQAYDAKAAKVEDLLKKLQAQLADHRHGFETEGRGRDWGYVGDLGRTAELLSQALGYEE